jgi:hypothetical protein
MSAACPLCGADLTGDPIPDYAPASHGDHTHYTRRVYLHRPLDKRNPVVYGCPDCLGEFDAHGNELSPPLLLG